MVVKMVGSTLLIHHTTLIRSCRSRSSECGVSRASSERVVTVWHQYYRYWDFQPGVLDGYKGIETIALITHYLTHS